MPVVCALVRHCKLHQCVDSELGTGTLDAHYKLLTTSFSIRNAAYGQIVSFGLPPKAAARVPEKIRSGRTPPLQVKPLVKLRGLLARQLECRVAAHVVLYLLPEQQQYPVADVLAHGRGCVGVEPALGQEQGGVWEVCTTQLSSAPACVSYLTS